MRRAGILSLLASFSILLSFASSLRAQANFYEGKTITIVIGAKGSGSLIVGAQILAHHLGKYIPGKPAVVVQNMPGAAHLLATNHVFNVAKPDGLTVLASNPNVAIAQLAKVEQVRFDVRKFHWLGSTGADGVLLAIRADLPHKNFDDIRKSDRELIVGSTGPGSNAHDFPLLLKEFAGAKFKIVSGYPSNGDVLLAIERKEVDVWAAFASTVRPAVERRAVRAIVRGRVAPPGFENLPVDEDLATSPLGKAIMGIKAAPMAIGRAFAVTPGTPADRVAMLREAMIKAIQDPELQAEAKKAKIDFQYISADQVIRDFNSLLNQPPEVLREMGKYIKIDN
ncbi:MAG TPA: tripartite tricarboxylate transporter substrate-binding protein [Candidatus Acidoferrales bacterium]|nr:tripartite tricarboxylate transporter substrate-binding protein [Candidatus Acidoferrales bacterium]